MKTGVLGGTFDPPHLAHLVLGAAARLALGLDRVLFVPAGDPYRKTDRQVSPAEVRWQMVRAATVSLSWAEVSRIEIERQGPTYSSDTLEALAREGGEWWFLLGHDALVDMEHWHAPRRLVATARLALAARPPAALTLPPGAAALVPGIEERIDRVPMPLLRLSSTDLRARVATGRPTDILLPVAVRRIVDEHGLYGANPD